MLKYSNRRQAIHGPRRISLFLLAVSAGHPVVRLARICSACSLACPHPALGIAALSLKCPSTLHRLLRRRRQQRMRWPRRWSPPAQTQRQAPAHTLAARSLASPPVTWPNWSVRRHRAAAGAAAGRWRSSMLTRPARGTLATAQRLRRLHGGKVHCWRSLLPFVVLATSFPVPFVPLLAAQSELFANLSSTDSAHSLGHDARNDTSHEHSHSFLNRTSEVWHAAGLRAPPPETALGPSALRNPPMGVGPAAAGNLTPTPFAASESQVGTRHSCASVRTAQQHEG